MLKNCLLNIRASETDRSKDIDSDKLKCLLNTIKQDNSSLVVLQREKKRFEIDSHQKELLCLAILSDTSTRNNEELTQVSDHIYWCNWIERCYKYLRMKHRINEDKMCFYNQ